MVAPVRGRDPVPAPVAAAGPADSAQTSPASWTACGTCRSLLFTKVWKRSLGVCPACGAHSPLTARDRLAALLDPGSCRLLEPVATVEDPLSFADRTPYAARLSTARAATGLPDAVVTATGAVHGHPLVAAVMDFAFLGGSLGVAAGEAVTVAAEHALAERVPLVLITASGGARMQEGALSLMQMAKTAAAMVALDEAGLLTVTIVTDPTYGGVAASFATLSDVLLCEPSARMGFAGPRVIAQTIREELPEGFQTGEFLLERGLVDDVRPRAELRHVLTVLLSAAEAARRPMPPITPRAVQLVRDPGRLPRRPSADVVASARNPGRPTTTDHLAYWMDSFVHLHGDRVGGDCAAIVGGIGIVECRPVMVIGHQKGHTTAEMVRCNFGMASPSGYRKVVRLARTAAKLGLPIVTLIDTPGAHPGVDAEKGGQAGAIAECLRVLSSVEVPVVAVITGEGGSGGALALGVADRVLISANATYSVISPEGCAAILWKAPDATATAGEALRLDPRSLLELGVVDGVIPEPPGGAHTDPVTASLTVRDAVLTALDELSATDPAALLAGRRHRFRMYGRVERTLRKVSA
jgi:acetyl-CoA carboxylase carboxyl transferase beta subunit/acetyl-CoA carboxylase carboxyl transferase alpha subunit